ncbi:response regulator [Paenibacillus sp. ISL-20]|uniref:response regulator n=1 Tax=Paenibacillus sp. ISL-20 TaxID=2819163 RepID=UPI001BE8C9CA|nr:response regulator [Paenibacillus sp. ISL-20]MBT2760921.1 response regulator [Paenibacillus sp. ISL-20]
MNVLLVDDDYFVVAALEKKIDWKALSIEQVYTAYSVAQARDILQQHSVQILICDIEMPQGSGLELLAWIREEQYSVQTIFLTNYADFNYAQKAIELQSFDYFLKPIEFDKLSLIISKAVYKAKEQQSDQEAIQDGQLWKKNQKKLQEHFWSKLIKERKASSDRAAIAGYITEQKLSYEMSDLFLPVLITIFPHDQSLGKEDKDLFDYAFLNVLSELFQDPLFTVEAAMEYKDYNWMVMLKWNHPPDSGVMENICTSFIEKANQFLRSDASCSVSISVALEEINKSIRMLLQMNEDMIKKRNQIVFLEHHSLQEATYTPPPLQDWEVLLSGNNPVGFLEETRKYLQNLAKNGVYNASVLRLFRLDIVQLVYSYLKGKEIQAHKLYTGKTNDQLFQQSLNSIEDMEKYTEYLVSTAAEYHAYADHSHTVVEEIKHYIHCHYGDELTRMSLAEIVYLNPDYLARVFKKETGVSLGTYIIQSRIKAAKHLLESTPLSVYQIAAKVGYANYSYFSKLFKQDTGWSPSDYRRVLQAGSSVKVDHAK